jgi:ribose transport system permease protein
MNRLLAPIGSSLGRMKAQGATAPTVAFLVFIASYIYINPNLLTPFQLQTSANLITPLALAALAQLIVVISGGIDISIGATMGLVNVSFALAMVENSAGISLAMGLGIGALVGVVNGLLIAYGRLPAIAVTLSMFFIVGALTRELMDRPGGGITMEFSQLVSGEIVPYVPSSIVWLILISVALWALMHRTVLGRSIFAAGSSPDGLEATGISYRRTILFTYVISGLIAAMAAIILAGTTLTGDPRAGDAYLLNSIAAVALAGVSFAGGRGSILGTIFAAMTLALISSLLFFAGINSNWSFVISALIVIAVVSLPALAKNFVTWREGRK